MSRHRFLSSGNFSESAIQKAVMDWVRFHPKIAPYIFHVANEGKRTLSYAVHLKEIGLRAGVSDLFVAIPAEKYHGLWIEFKSEKGRLSAAQKQFFEDMKFQGYDCQVCRSIEEGIEIISTYCAISRHRDRIIMTPAQEMIV